MTPQQRIFALDPLRLFAALAVLYYHYTTRWPEYLDFNPGKLAMPYGYLGVHLFFIISGFVILPSAIGSSAASFRIKRAIRLYPLFAICGTLTILAKLVLPSSAWPITLKDSALHYTMLGVFPFSDRLHIRPVDGVYWSLGVEILFYLFVAFAIGKGFIKRTAIWGGALLIVAVFVRFGALSNHVPHLVNQVCRWPIIGTVGEWAPFFVAGSMFFNWKSAGRISRAQAGCLALAYVLCVVNTYTGATVRDDLVARPNPWVAVAIVTAFYLFFIVLCTRNSRPSRVLSGRSIWVLELLGLMSYPLYLIHQDIGVALIHLMKPATGFWFAMLIVTILMLALSALLCLAVEKPLLGVLRNRLLPKRT